MTEIKWYARGGQGGFTASKMLGLSAVLYDGKYAQAFPSFGPERRGAPVYSFTRIDTRPIRDHSQLYSCDYAIVLDSTLMGVMDVSQGLRGGGTLFVNTPKSPEELGFDGVNVVTYDAASVAAQVLGTAIANTAMMAVMAAVTGIADDSAMIKAVRDGMSGRIAELNAELISRVYGELTGLSAGRGAGK